MSEARLSELEHDSFIRAFSLVAEFSSNGFVARHGGVVAAVSHSPIPFFNQILIEEVSATVADLEAAMAEVKAVGVRFSVLLRRGVDDRFRPIVDESSLEVSGASIPGMVMRPIVDHEMPQELEIRTGRDRAVFEAHVDVVARSFVIPRELVDTFMLPEMVDDDSITFYSGHVDGEAVASSFGLRNGSSITVFNVGTVEGFRGRGYGAAMTMRVALDGRAAGCDLAILQSTQLGYPVYERLGFETVVEYDQWAPPGSETGN